MSGIDLRELARTDLQREQGAERERAEAARAAAREQYHQMLLAAADGEPVDAAELRAVMATLGLTADRVKADQEEVEAYRERERAREDAQEAQAAATQARDAVAAHRLETQRFWRERAPAHAALVDAQTAAETRLRDAQNTAYRYAEALQGNPELLARVVAHDRERAKGKGRPAKS